LLFLVSYLLKKLLKKADKNSPIVDKGRSLSGIEVLNLVFQK